MKLRVKGLGLLLLLVLLALCSTIDVCDARRGKHWRPRSSPSSSLLRNKGKGKKGSSNRQHGSNRPSPKPPLSPPPSPGNGKGYQSPYQPSPSPSPNAPVSPSPVNGSGHASPKSPTPSCGKGNQPPSRPTPTSPQGAVFNVVDFGAKGDGVSDDTKAFEAAWAAACKQGASTVVVPSELEFLVGPISFSGPYCKPNILFQLDGTIVAPTSAKAWGSGLLQWIEFTKLNGVSIQGNGIINGRGQQWWTYSDIDDDEDDDTQYDVEFERMPQVKPTALRFYGSFNVVVAGITIVNSSQCHLKFDSCQGVMVHDVTISSPENSLNTDGIHLQNSKDGGLGLVQDVRFSNIQVSEVQTPIIIDQFYCDKRTCSNQTSAVAVSGVQYENIRGTFTIKPVHFACSDSSPCSGITLTGVQLRPVQIPHYRLNDPFCWQAFGELYTPTVPPIACLHLGKPAGNNLQSYHDLC
uniref:Polygalacturonase n=1 Tax=Oryza rufipogon TaxID=4529 RepID=A0A0E0MZR3_ORYRU